MNASPSIICCALAVSCMLDGCDRELPPAVTGAAAAGVSVGAMGSLEAGGRTSLYVRGDGATLALQADAEKPLRGLAGISPVNAAVLRERLGAAGENVADGGAGSGEFSIRAVAALNGRLMLVYAAGSHQRTSLASLWIVDANGSGPAGASAATLVVRASALAGASGLGDSLDLADAQMVATDRGVWMCLYHSDAAVFFLLPPGLGPGTVLHPAFTRLKDDAGDVRLERGDRLFARGNGLGLLKADGGLMAIGDDGRVSPLPSPDDGGRVTAPPLSISIGDAAYTLNFCVNDGPAPDPFAIAPFGGQGRYPKMILVPQGAAQVAVQGTVQSAPQGNVPAPKSASMPTPMLTPTQTSAHPIVFDRDAITIRPGFPVHALRITSWCQDPASGDVIAYDAFSGEVMRIKLPS